MTDVITDVNETTLPQIVAKFDEVVGRGFSSGVGQRDGQMCVEAAICYAMGLPHGDEPPCVALSVRSFKIRLNDAGWASPESRAAGLRDIGIAQLGSKGVVDGQRFVQIMQIKTVNHLLPLLFRTVWPDGRMDEVCGKMEGARTNEEARTAALKGRDAAYAAYAADADAAAAYAAAAAAYDAYDAYAAAAAKKNLNPETFLLLSARLAYDTLVELGSPGALWLEKECVA